MRAGTNGAHPSGPELTMSRGEYNWRL